MHRRSFLRSTATLATSCVLAPLSQLISASPSGKPSLGFSLYGMKTVPLSESLNLCKDIGYDHVEIALNKGYVTDPDTFKSEQRTALASDLATLKLEMPCLMVNLSLVSEKAVTEGIPVLEKAASFARHLNPTQPPLIETVLGGKPAEWDQLKDGMIANLRRWAETAEKHRVTIALKAHVNSAVNSPERLALLLESVPSSSLAAAYDFSHFQLQGIEMEASMQTLLPKTRFIHVKDSVKDEKGFRFVLPGEGSIDYLAFFTLLKKFKYTGPVCVEVSGQVFSKPGYDPKVAAIKSFEALATPLRRVFA
jgi:sugar phosphate isomerase/epimerase